LSAKDERNSTQKNVFIRIIKKKVKPKNKKEKNERNERKKNVIVDRILSREEEKARTESSLAESVCR